MSIIAVVFDNTASFSGDKISKMFPDFTANGDSSPYKSNVEDEDDRIDSTRQRNKIM